MAIYKAKLTRRAFIKADSRIQAIECAQNLSPEKWRKLEELVVDLYQIEEDESHWSEDEYVDATKKEGT